MADAAAESAGGASLPPEDYDAASNLSLLQARAPRGSTPFCALGEGDPREEEPVEEALLRWGPGMRRGTPASSPDPGPRRSCRHPLPPLPLHRPSGRGGRRRRMRSGWPTAWPSFRRRRTRASGGLTRPGGGRRKSGCCESEMRRRRAQPAHSPFAPRARRPAITVGGRGFISASVLCVFSGVKAGGPRWPPPAGLWEKGGRDAWAWACAFMTSRRGGLRAAPGANSLNISLTDAT